MNRLAPVLLFTYKRLSVLQQTVNALKLNYLAEVSELYIFSDGAKQINDKQTINEIRKYLKTINGFKSITIIESEENKGLAKSIIDGVTEIINIYGKVIVLEDDLLTTPNFLTFMNHSLDKYFQHDNVISISGYSFNLSISQKFINNEDAYFLNRGWSWGWATWKNRWEFVDWEVNDYYSFLKDPIARKSFAKGGSDLNGMLDRQMSGKLDSWAIRWFYHQFRNQGLTLYPLKSKIYNDGFDNNATHTTGSSKRYIPDMDIDFHSEFHFPEIIQLNPVIQRRFQERMGFNSRVKSKIETFILKLIKMLNGLFIKKNTNFFVS